jgi:hypothetical protein
VQQKAKCGLLETGLVGGSKCSGNWKAEWEGLVKDFVPCTACWKTMDMISRNETAGHIANLKYKKWQNYQEEII